MTKFLTLFLSTLFIFEFSIASATTPIPPPRNMTIGLLQLLCKKDGKSADPSNVSSNAYCDGYIRALIESYFAQLSGKRASFKRNACVVFPSHDWLTEEIREEILAISEERDLNLHYGLAAEPWIRARIVAKCEPKK
jgi:hypothetical protein